LPSVTILQYSFAPLPHRFYRGREIVANSVVFATGGVTSTAGMLQISGALNLDGFPATH
jgi:hypothetical protein